MANLIEEVVKIRQILENGSDGDGDGGSEDEGGFTLKSISFENTTENEVGIFNCINAEGKFIDPVEADGLVKVPAGETVTVYYPEPGAYTIWKMYVETADNLVLNTEAVGITTAAMELAIAAEAPDGATVAIEVYSGD